MSGQRAALRRRQTVFRWASLVLAVAFFAAPLLPLQIAGTMSSEVILGQENVGKAMALAMIVVVALVMTAYVFLDRRASRWMQR